jgi:hypothetical protein
MTTVLEEANELVYGDRQADYGHPAHNMQVVADLWSVYLRRGSLLPMTISAADAATMLLLLKVARVATGSLKRDTVVDMAGYAGVLARVEGLDK